MQRRSPAIVDELTLHLLKPIALVNKLGPIVDRYHGNLSIRDSKDKIILLHDELDIAPLAVRLRNPPHSHKPRGHNALASVLKAVPAPYHNLIHTIGIGIGRDPFDNSQDNTVVGNWQTSPLQRAEIEACTWIPGSDPNGSSMHGKVVKEVWKKIRIVTSFHDDPV